MSTIIMRSALVFHGHNPAPDVHSIVIDRWGRRVVTWADVMRERREWQAEILRRKRAVRETRAYRIWVAYFDQTFFGGWQAFIGDFRGRRGQTWIDRDGGIDRRALMQLFPLALPLGRDERERFDDWKPMFAERYRAGTHHRRPRGCAFIWWDGRGEPRYAGRPRRR